MIKLIEEEGDHLVRVYTVNNLGGSFLYEKYFDDRREAIKFINKLKTNEKRTNQPRAIKRNQGVKR
jgi:hypothetical protein